MFAAQLFNAQEGRPLPKAYGAVTTGNTWKFLKYENGAAYIDLPEYHIANPGKIVGILAAMVRLEA